MVLSFVYLAFVALLRLLLRSGRRVEVKTRREDRRSKFYEISDNLN